MLNVEKRLFNFLHKLIRGPELAVHVGLGIIKNTAGKSFSFFTPAKIAKPGDWYSTPVCTVCMAHHIEHITSHIILSYHIDHTLNQTGAYIPTRTITVHTSA